MESQIILYEKIKKEINRRHKLKKYNNEKIAKRQLMKLLEIEKTNRLYEIKSKNDNLFKEQKFLIKNYAIKIFAGVATTAAGVIKYHML